MAQNTLVVDDVGGPERDAGIRPVLNEAAVVPGNLVGHIREQRHVHRAKTAVLALLLGVLHMDEVGIDRAPNQLSIQLFEFASLVAELANLGRAHESKVKGPEEEAHVFALELGKRQGLELVLVPGSALEGGGSLADDCFGHNN